jgi:hypothetical protein
VFDDIDTLRACPLMPYHDPDRPYVRAWFASSNGCWCRHYLECLSEERQDELEASGGACIVYTHFASEFQTAAGLDPRFKRLMRRLAGKNGWFAPVSAILDHIARQRGTVELSTLARQRLEWRWFRRKLLVGGTE